MSMHFSRTAAQGLGQLRRLLTIPLLVITVGWVIAMFVTTASSYFILVAAVAIVLGFILARNLQVGVLGYLFIAALAFGESPGIQSPNSGYRAGLMPSQLILGFLAILWVARSVLTTGLRFVKTELNVPLITLVLVAFASLLANNIVPGTRETPSRQMLITQVAEVGLLGCSACAYFLAANILSDPRWIRRVYAPVVLLGVYFAAHRIFHFDLPIPMIWGSFLLAAALGFVYSRLLFDRPARTTAIGLSLLFAILLYAALSNLSWVSGWIASVGVVMVISYYRSKILGIVLLALALLAIFVYPGVYHSIHEESELGGDFDRFIIWADAFRMFMSVNPVLGIGPGNYNLYAYYHNTLWFGSGTYTTAHSNYVQLASELGLMGLAVFLWVIVAGIRMGMRASRSAPPELRWLGVSAAALLAGIAVASLFGDYLFPSRGNNGIVNFGTTVYTWLIMGAAAASANLSDSSHDGDDTCRDSQTKRRSGGCT